MTFGCAGLQKEFFMVLSHSEISWEKIDIQGLQNLNNNATLLWAFNADRIPPHLGISSEGVYFSLKVNGKDESISVSRILELVEKKGIHTLVFELEYLSVGALTKTFEKYSRAISGQVTCLDPIKEIYGLEAATIHDLLSNMFGRQQVKNVVGINLPDDFKGIPPYNVTDIYNHLIALEGVQR